jgi:hypothetical protein
MPKEKVDRWLRQSYADYATLPDSEKGSDREIADELLTLLKEHGVIV